MKQYHENPYWLHSRLHFATCQCCFGSHIFGNESGDTENVVLTSIELVLWLVHLSLMQETKVQDSHVQYLHFLFRPLKKYNNKLYFSAPSKGVAKRQS